MKKILMTMAILALGQTAFAGTLAEVNGTKIDSKTIDKYVKHVKEDVIKGMQAADDDKLKFMMLDQAIKNQVLADKAKEAKTDKSDFYKTTLEKDFAALDKAKAQIKNFDTAKEMLQTDVLVRSYVKKLADETKVADKDLKDVYDNLKKEADKAYKGSKTLHVRTIYAKDEATAKKAIKELEGGKDFLEVAKTYSSVEVDQRYANNRSDLINDKDLETADPGLSKAIKALKPGQFTKTPQKSGPNGGYVVVQLVKTEPYVFPKLEELKASLEAQVKEQLVQRKLLKDLEGAKISLTDEGKKIQSAALKDLKVNAVQGGNPAPTKADSSKGKEKAAAK